VCGSLKDQPKDPCGDFLCVKMFAVPYKTVQGTEGSRCLCCRRWGHNAQAFARQMLWGCCCILKTPKSLEHDVSVQVSPLFKVAIEHLADMGALTKGGPCPLPQLERYIWSIV
jgi:hypothetical protein